MCSPERCITFNTTSSNFINLVECFGSLIRTIMIPQNRIQVYKQRISKTNIIWRIAIPEHFFKKDTSGSGQFSSPSLSNFSKDKNISVLFCSCGSYFLVAKLLYKSKCPSVCPYVNHV